jgi:glycerol-3-phosphate acyltransferase PlsX
MRIALDAMGGDLAPGAAVQGALLYHKREEHPHDIVLVGQEDRLGELLTGLHDAESIEIVHAPETVAMDEAGPIAIGKKKDSSLSVAMRFLAEGKVDAVVSAGNSGATVAAAKHFVGVIPGFRRPALVVPIPTIEGEVLLTDAGAYLEANAFQLAQLAALAHAYLKTTTQNDEPRLGLLNIGNEPLKGTQGIRKAYVLLDRSPLNFVGNIEPGDVLKDRVDAVICSGLLGNVFLKLFESLCENLLTFCIDRIRCHDMERNQSLDAELNRLRERHYYQRVGGAPLLGICKTVVIAHGCSDSSAIANAILGASRLAASNVSERMSCELMNDPSLKDLRHRCAQGMLERWKSKWGFSAKQD